MKWVLSLHSGRILAAIWNRVPAIDSDPLKLSLPEDDRLLTIPTQMWEGRRRTVMEAWTKLAGLNVPNPLGLFVQERGVAFRKWWLRHHEYL